MIIINAQCDGDRLPVPSSTPELLTYKQTKPNETKAWFRGFLCHPTRKRIEPMYSSQGLHGAVVIIAAVVGDDVCVWSTCRRSLAAQQRARAKEAISQTKSLQSSLASSKKALQVRYVTGDKCQ